MKGIIVVNPFGYPENCVRQAERLKFELTLIGVDVKIENAGWAKYSVGNKVNSEEQKPDFAIFLDKDKYLSSVLSKSGVRLFNSHEAIRVCDDKGETYLALTDKGINLPETYFAPLCYKKDLQNNKEDIVKVGKKLGYPVIIKESFGSMGKGVYKADDEESLIKIAEKLKLVPHLYQKYLPYKFGTDIRVIVIGGKVVASMERVNERDFRSNIALGGTGKKIELKKEFCDIAERTAKTLGLDYCGVDLLYGEKNEPYVCEVNSNAFFEEIERVTGENVARKYALYVVDSVMRNKWIKS